MGPLVIVLVLLLIVITSGSGAEAAPPTPHQVEIGSGVVEVILIVMGLWFAFFVGLLIYGWIDGWRNAKKFEQQKGSDS